MEQGPGPSLQPKYKLKLRKVCTTYLHEYFQCGRGGGRKWFWVQLLVYTATVT